MLKTDCPRAARGCSLRAYKLLLLLYHPHHIAYLPQSVVNVTPCVILCPIYSCSLPVIPSPVLPDHE